eukprot:scaffold224925_cov30-Tisochrysis_lutea.AAC.4
MQWSKSSSWPCAPESTDTGQADAAARGGLTASGRTWGCEQGGEAKGHGGGEAGGSAQERAEEEASERELSGAACRVAHRERRA